MVIVIISAFVCTGSKILAEESTADNAVADEKPSVFEEQPQINNKEEFNPKFTETTKLRYDAFGAAVTHVDPAEFADKANIPLYYVDDKNIIRKNKIKKAKVTEYTNDTYSIKFKTEKDKLYIYDLASSDLKEYVVYSNGGKIPYTGYHYDNKGYLKTIEVKPSRYHSYIYGPDALLKEYFFYDDCYSPSGQRIYSKKGL